MQNREDDPVCVWKVQQEWEAALLIDALAEAGIRAMTSGGLTAGFRAEAPGLVEIIVQRRDAEGAKLVIERVRRERAQKNDDGAGDGPAA
ncbi:MAG: DUF2007 domain-containing protein [Phycisphaerales bacterium]